MSKVDALLFWWWLVVITLYTVRRHSTVLLITTSNDKPQHHGHRVLTTALADTSAGSNAYSAMVLAQYMSITQHQRKVLTLTGTFNLRTFAVEQLQQNCALHHPLVAASPCCGLLNPRTTLTAYLLICVQPAIWLTITRLPATRVLLSPSLTLCKAGKPSNSSALATLIPSSDFCPCLNFETCVRASTGESHIVLAMLVGGCESIIA